ncbi:MAG TPA: hypothetical protein PLJ29_02835 [Leptospiraceae bacterium]|nr:hypothetical protein [Leptospiraceae bacterium]
MNSKITLLFLSLFTIAVYSQRGVHPGLNLTGPGGGGSSDWIQPKNKSLEKPNEHSSVPKSSTDPGAKKFECRINEKGQEECTKPKLESNP